MFTDMALRAIRENLARRACDAPREEISFFMERARLHHEMEHLATGDQQRIWYGSKRTAPPVDTKNQSALSHLPNVASGMSVCGKDKVCRFKIVGEMCFRDTPEELAERAVGSRMIELQIDTAGGNGDWAHDFGTRLRAIGCPIVATAEHAFSAGALLLQYAHTRRIRSTGRVMVHGPQYACFGGAEDFLRVAAWLEAGKADDIALYLERTKQTRHTVESWLAKDTYFTPHEAIAYNLADVVVD